MYKSALIVLIAFVSAFCFTQEISDSTITESIKLTSPTYEKHDTVAVYSASDSSLKFISSDSLDCDSARVAGSTLIWGGRIFPSDGTNNQVLTTDGAGSLFFSDKSGGTAGTINSINGSSETAQTLAGDNGIVVVDSGTGNYIHKFRPSPGRIIPFGSGYVVDSASYSKSTKDHHHSIDSVYYLTDTLEKHADTIEELKTLRISKLDVSDTSVFARDNDIALKLDKAAFSDSISEYNIGSTGYLGIFTGTNSIGSSGILKNGSSYGMGGAYINNDGAAGVGLSFTTSNQLRHTRGAYNAVSAAYFGPDEESEYLGLGVIDDEVNITAGSSGGDNVDLVIRTSTAGSESENMRFKYHGALQTNGNYINNDGATSEGLTFGSSNNAIFTERVGVGTNSPSTGAKLHLYSGAGGGATNTSEDDFIVESSGNSYISINTPADKQGGVLFSDGSRNRGSVLYSHLEDKLKCASGGSTRLALFSDGTIATYGNYINNDGTASEGLAFDASNNATFTENLTVGDSIINAKLTSHLLSLLPISDTSVFARDNDIALKLDKAAFSDSLNENIGSDYYLQKALGSKLVNSALQDDGTRSILSYGTSLAAPYTSNKFTVEDNVSTGIGIMSPNNTYNYFTFGNATNSFDGGFVYSHVDHLLQFKTNNTNGPFINYNGTFGMSGNAINYDGTTAEGIVFNSDNDVTFTEDVYTLGSDTVSGNLYVYGSSSFDYVSAGETDLYSLGVNQEITADSVYARAITVSEETSPCTLWNNGQQDIGTAYKQTIGKRVCIHTPYLDGGLSDSYEILLKFDDGFIDAQEGSFVKVMSGQDTTGQRFANVGIKDGTSDHEFIIDFFGSVAPSGTFYIFSTEFGYRKQ